MSFWKQWASNYRRGRIIGVILLMPVFVIIFYVMQASLAERCEIVLQAPRTVTAYLNDDVIPKESASPAKKQGNPLLYQFKVDSGSYKFRFVDDETAAVVEQRLRIEYENAPQVYLTVVETDDGRLQLDVGGETSITGQAAGELTQVPPPKQ